MHKSQKLYTLIPEKSCKHARQASHVGAYNRSHPYAEWLGCSLERIAYYTIIGPNPSSAKVLWLNPPEHFCFVTPGPKSELA